MYARFSFAEGIYLIKQGMQCNKTMLHTRYFFIYQKRLFYVAFIFYPISCRRAIVNTFAHTDKGFDVCKAVYIYANIKKLTDTGCICKPDMSVSVYHLLFTVDVFFSLKYVDSRSAR